MAKTKPAKPKKRTKKAVAARRCERKLQKRAKAGEPAAIARIEKRREYNKNYQAKKKQEQEERSRRFARQRTGSAIRVSMRDSSDEDTGEVDSAIGGLEGDDEEERERSPLFCTPAPPTRLRLAPDRNVRRAIPTIESSKNGRSKVPAQRPSHYAPEIEEATDMPLWQQRLNDRRARAAAAERTQVEGQPGPQKVGGRGRGRLVRRSLGGQLTESPDAAPLRTASTGESVETLQLLRQKIRNARDALLKEEVDVEIKLRQRAAHGQCHQ